MILNEYVDQKVFRTAYFQWGAAKDEQALITFHEAGFFRELQWKRIKHNKVDGKAIDGWFQFITFWTWRRKPRMNMSLSVDHGKCI